MTEQELQAVRERCEKATPGPWVCEHPLTGGKREWCCPSLIRAAPAYPPAHCYGSNLTDAEFIAAAREDVPRLLAEVARLKAEVARLKADDTDLDGTDAARPAWARGNDAGTGNAVRAIALALDGQDGGHGVYGPPDLEALRRRVLALVAENRRLKDAADPDGYHALAALRQQEE